jgi:hypothetical protein
MQGVWHADCNRRGMNTKMTAAEKTERIRAMNSRWYETRAKHGAQIADEELEESMRAYFAEMDRRGGA